MTKVTPTRTSSAGFKPHKPEEIRKRHKRPITVGMVVRTLGGEEVKVLSVDESGQVRLVGLRGKFNPDSLTVIEPKGT